MKYIKGIIYIKSRIVICIIIMLVSIIFTSNILFKTAPQGISLSIFDLLALPSGGGITGPLSLTFPIVPIFCFILICLLNLDYRNISIIREKSRKNIWNKQSILIIMLSFIYSFIVVFGGYIISGLIIKDFDNKWGDKSSYIVQVVGDNTIDLNISALFNTPVMILVIFLALFLGLCAIGFFINMLKINLKNIYTYILVIIILLFDATNGNFSFILKQMTLNATNWIEPISIILNYLYLLIVSFTCYVIAKEIIKNKDFFIG